MFVPDSFVALAGLDLLQLAQRLELILKATHHKLDEPSYWTAGRVLLHLPRDERTPATTSGRRPAESDLGGVPAQLNSLRLGAGELVRQRPMAQAGRPGTVHPRSARNVRTSAIARVTVERSTSNSKPGAPRAADRAADEPAWPPVERRTPTGGGPGPLRLACGPRLAQHGDDPRPRPTPPPPTSRLGKRDDLGGSP